MGAMMIQVRIGTIEWKACPSGVPEDGYVLFSGEWIFAPDRLTSYMVWDAGLNNARTMTQAEIDAIPALRKAAQDAAEPDMATVRDQATQAIADINTFLAIASPSNAQILAEVRAIDQRQRAIIKALARLVIKTL